MREKEKNFYKEKGRMEGIYRSKVEEQSKNAYKQAQEEVREIESHIDQKNVVLFQELKGHQKVIGSLKGENRQIQERHNNIKRDLQLDQDELNEYDQINLRSHKQIQSLKAQLNYIRHFISDEVHSYTKQIETEKQKARDNKEHLHAQIQSNPIHLILSTHPATLRGEPQVRQGQVSGQNTPGAEGTH